MTKLIRSMTIEDEQGASITIDALDVTDFDVSNCMLTIEHQYQEHLHFFSKSNSEIFRMFNAELYEALNAPVQVTQEVLDAMEKAPEAKFLVNIANDTFLDCWVRASFTRCGNCLHSKHSPSPEWIVEIAYVAQECGDRDCIYTSAIAMLLLEKNTIYIKPDCPLALQVLLQFYTDGTPVKKESKHE